MNRYKYLLKNIGLLTLSSFATKLISFFLVPLYTNVLTTSEYGTYDLFNTTVGVLLPILTLNVQDAVMRFAIDSKNNRRAIISVAVKILIIAPIDGSALTEVIDKAAEQGIKVISYDRLITNTKNIEYYATFDNFKVGVLEGEYIEKTLGLKENNGPFTIEVFGGSPDDNNAYFFYDGAMSILTPYIESGKLVVRSNQLGMDKVATLRWDGALAQARMDNLLGTYYTDGKLDAVLSPYDGISLGIVSSLKSMGFGSNGKKMPVVTGQDAEIASVKSIIAGEQTQTVLKDTSKLAEVASKMVDSILKGKEVEVNDTTTYNNGIKVVPSYLLEPVSVDINNWKKELVESGYYTEEQILN